MGGAALLREARRAGLGDNSTQGGAALEDTGGRPRRRADCGLPCGGAVADGASRLGQDVLDSLGLLLYCRELLDTVLDSVVEQTSLGDESIEKARFVDIAPLSKAEPQMALLDHKCGHRCDFRRP